MGLIHKRTCRSKTLVLTTPRHCVRSLLVEGAEFYKYTLKIFEVEKWLIDEVLAWS